MKCSLILFSSLAFLLVGAAVATQKCKILKSTCNVDGTDIASRSDYDKKCKAKEVTEDCSGTCVSTAKALGSLLNEFDFTKQCKPAGDSALKNCNKSHDCNEPKILGKYLRYCTRTSCCTTDLCNEGRPYYSSAPISGPSFSKWVMVFPLARAGFALLGREETSHDRGRGSVRVHQLGRARCSQQWRQVRRRCSLNINWSHHFVCVRVCNCFLSISAMAMAFSVFYQHLCGLLLLAAIFFSCIKLSLSILQSLVCFNGSAHWHWVKNQLPLWLLVSNFVRVYNHVQN